MTRTKSPMRLHKHLAHMIALEATIEQRLEELIPQVSDHHEATALLTDFQAVSKDQRQALEARLHAITDNPPQLQISAANFAIPGLSEDEDHPVPVGAVGVAGCVVHAGHSNPAGRAPAVGVRPRVRRCAAPPSGRCATPGVQAGSPPAPRPREAAAPCPGRSAGRRCPHRTASR